jgi:hypothetical protein
VTLYLVVVPSGVYVSNKSIHQSKPRLQSPLNRDNTYST